MKYVGVKHKGNDTIYWFKVPKELARLANVGDLVLCDTKYGLQEGAVKLAIEGFSEEVSRFISGNQKKFKSIKYVRKKVKTDFITVSYDFDKMNPENEKIEKRIEELNDTGCFQTKVIIDTNFRLYDGYSAFLVAKVFGIPEFEAWVCGAKHE